MNLTRTPAFGFNLTIDLSQLLRGAEKNFKNLYVLINLIEEKSLVFMNVYREQKRAQRAARRAEEDG